ncbi:MAG: hypothetical protein II702_06535 [Clostridia bacterium]|nr:hypothetical protein [Clostridia bacterium]
MKKKILIILLAAVCLAGGGIGGFLYGRKTKTETKPPEIYPPLCTIDSFQDNDKEVSVYATSPNFGADYLQKRFNMSASKAKNLVEHPEEWLGCQVFIHIENQDTIPIYVYGTDCTNNGKDGVYIYTGMKSETKIIERNGYYNYPVTVLINNNEVSIDEARKMLNSLDFSVIYGADASYEDCENYYRSVDKK